MPQRPDPDEPIMDADSGCAVPMVILPHPVVLSPYGIDPWLCALWAEVVDGLDEAIDRIEDGSPLDKPIRSAADAAGRLAACLLAAVTCPDPETLRPPVRVHSDYFRVRHTDLTPAQQATQAAVIIFRSLMDVRLAMLDVNDVIAELEAMRTVLELLQPDPVGEPTNIPPVAAFPADWYEPTGDWMDRWFLAHHLYFLFNVYATHELDRAVEATGAGERGQACAAIRRVTVLVRGFTAGMLHSSAMSARYYRDVVRPTMSPPHVAMNLTGVMQLEHRRYRAALTRLLDAVPDTHPDLHERYPELAIARDDLLEADLVDMERHVTVAAVLVGGDRSLVQPGTTTQNATSTLRKMRHLRAASYQRLMQFGDSMPTTVRGRGGGEL